MRPLFLHSSHRILACRGQELRVQDALPDNDEIPVHSHLSLIVLYLLGATILCDYFTLDIWSHLYHVT
jgi:hypothetical protein